MADKIWAEGLYARRRGNAPDFVTVSLGIDVERFCAWLQRQPVSDRGYLNIDITRSRDGTKYSAALDTWEPARSERPQLAAADAGSPFDDQIPFMTHERGWLV